MSYKDYSSQYLRSIILYGLDNDLLPSAEFAAEKLLAETGEDNHDSLHLYALVLLKKNRYKAAYNITANVPHVGCAFVFAKAALKLDRNIEGIVALTNIQHLWETSSDSLYFSYENDRKLLPDAASIYSLLGRLYYASGDIKESCINHAKALKKNPYIWESFEELNKIGANVRVKAIYKVHVGTKFPLTSDLLNINGNTGGDMNESPPKDPFGDAPSAFTVNSNTSFYNQKQFSSAPEASEVYNEFSTPRLKHAVLPNAPSRMTRASSRDVFKQPNGTSSATAINNSSSNPQHDSSKRNSRLTATKVTSRLISQPLSSANKHSNSLRSKNTPNEFSFKRGRALLSSTLNPSSEFGSSMGKKELLSNEEVGEQHLLGIYSKYAKGYKAMCKYDCFKAIRIFSSLSGSHLNSPWVLSKLGRLHFEIVNYEESEIFFKKLRNIDRTRVEDMEHYSTLLWHLHKEVELCHLSRDLLNINRNAPETWVAVGNLFSLIREPDEAIKCFERATQLNEKFSYAYTLQGHEYVANDAYENALESFRYAILMDPRHYNALYGIGMVYLKLGNFNRAELHFRKAVDINPVNVILLCCVGMMLEKLGKKEQALQQYELACKIQPLSALALFKKAQLLFSLEQYAQALEDFEKLSNVAPDEASAHFLLGQLYKIFNRRNDAITQFTIALNLDPKGSHLVKEALESLTA